MLGRFAHGIRALGFVPRQAFRFPEPTSETHHKPGLTAKRIIKCVSDRLKKIDPDRWNVLLGVRQGRAGQLPDALA